MSDSVRSNRLSTAIDQARGASSASGVAITQDEAARILAGMSGPVERREAISALVAQGFSDAEIHTLLNEGVARVNTEDSRALARAGFRVGEGGRDTLQTAIHAFQTAQGLTPTGIMDAATRSALRANDATEGPVASQNLDVRSHERSLIMQILEFLADLFTGFSTIDTRTVDGAIYDAERADLQTRGQALGQHAAFGRAYGDPPNRQRLERDIAAELVRQNPGLPPAHAQRRAEVVAEAAITAAAGRPANTDAPAPPANWSHGSGDIDVDSSRPPPASELPPHPLTAANVPGETHTVVRGDTYSAIVRDHPAYASLSPRPTHQEVLAYNQTFLGTDITDANRIRPGQTIFLPSAEELQTFRAQRQGWGTVQGARPYGQLVRDPATMSVDDLHRELSQMTYMEIDNQLTGADRARRGQLQTAYQAKMAEALGLPAESVRAVGDTVQINYDALSFAQLEHAEAQMRGMIGASRWQSMNPALYINHVQAMSDRYAQERGEDPARYAWDFTNHRVIPHTPPPGSSVRRTAEGGVERFYRGGPTEMIGNDPPAAPATLDAWTLWNEIDTLEGRRNDGFATPGDTARLEELTTYAREHNVIAPPRDFMIAVEGLPGTQESLASAAAAESRVTELYAGLSPMPTAADLMTYNHHYLNHWQSRPSELDGGTVFLPSREEMAAFLRQRAAGGGGVNYAEVVANPRTMTAAQVDAELTRLRALPDDQRTAADRARIPLLEARRAELPR